MRPRVQCSTGPFWAFSLEVAMDALAEAGFQEIELMVTRDPRTQDPEIPRRLAEERGLRIASVHGPFLVITKNVWGLDPIGKIKRGAEMCKAVGADTMIVHPPYFWEREYTRWVDKQAEAFEAQTGVTVAVETMYPVWVAGRKLRAYRWLDPRELVQACHRVVMDTSHVTVARGDILDAYQVLAPKLVHLHLSDNAGDGRDGHLSLGDGILPIDRLLAELRRTRYSGAVSLELSVSRFVERPKELVATLRRNREYVEDRLFRRERVAKGLPREGAGSPAPAGAAPRRLGGRSK
ncbi:MAG TPA: sugar phosphate isomerase/epimerase family protein [Actinomycetota bacterium]|nr:sugar phosphate isomerase/epimerase family protein [Actinomycetota bacterium]